MRENDHPQLDSTTLKKRLEEGILSELLPYRQWVVWRYSLVNGQWKKQPYNPVNGRAAKTNDRRTWGTINQALYQLETGGYHGIGFVFSDEDPFTGTDLDGAVNEDGTIAEWAQPYIDVLNSYTEYSPSRRGLHILTKAVLPGPGRKAGKVEMYATTQYFTITADHLMGTPLTINERQAVQTMLYENLVASVALATENTGEGLRPRTVLKRSDREIIQKGRKLKTAQYLPDYGTEILPAMQPKAKRISRLCSFYCTGQTMTRAELTGCFVSLGFLMRNGTGHSGNILTAR